MTPNAEWAIDSEAMRPSFSKTQLVGQKNMENGIAIKGLRTLYSLQETNVCHFGFLPLMKTLNGQIDHLKFNYGKVEKQIYIRKYSNVAVHNSVDSAWNKNPRIEGLHKETAGERIIAHSLSALYLTVTF